ncbi:hypothetical protein CONPUDRAFT_75500 [Coniophora puteana RWD-64-598 SS2]|uniref:Uncharacterized protein n=1 Tax=Coniophora puteana (strain RWD-64-598) TaxID=741705 RepID=A0A5M3MEM8_CONPW|nr:uncharacterized protein CONPUDRAFT_75500 [Coniophora puteana RWD-64-598 SS2]EIW77678.1 hypothetical protein CONPUDRAFT_75500 [Coniophora puteana RWD-64-598 SS2]
MPRTAKNTLPDVFEEKPDDSKKIRCRECIRVWPKSTWISRASQKKHCESQEHHTAVQRNFEQAEAANLQAVSDPYELFYRTAGGVSMSLIPPPLIARNPRPHMLSALDTPQDHDDCSNDMIIDLQAPPSVDALAIEAERMALERERIQEQIQLLLMDAQSADFMDSTDHEDDVTLSNVVHDFRDMDLQHGPSEEDVHDFFNANVQMDSDYAPYPSKVVRASSF